MGRSSLIQSTMSIAVTLAIVFPLLVWCVPITDSTNTLCEAVCLCENLTEEKIVKADCSRVYLSIVPPINDWPRNITHMDLSTNNISTLDFEMSHDTVEVLDLSYNRINSVVQNAFGGLKTLQYLNLANNMIKGFKDNGFYGLDQLKSLNISSNGLTKLPDNIFYNFLGLQELSLADNPLVHLDPLHLNRMVTLRWLDLSNTDLYALPPNIFHTTGQLEFLDLSGNDFVEVPTDALRSASQLKHLRLNENPIDVLDKKSFVQLSTLEVLELSNMNRLEKVLEQTFSDLTSLRTLEMKYNRHFSIMDPKAFQGLFNASRPVLQELDLESNNLFTMDRNAVACARMKMFNVQKNPWVCDCNMKWIKKCQIQKIYAADLKCMYPEKLEDALVFNLVEEDFVCDYKVVKADAATQHHDRVVKSISVAVAVGILVSVALAIAMVLKWKDIKTWYRYRKRGPGAVYYVRARANPNTTPITN